MTGYDPETFDSLKYMMHGDEAWRRYTQADLDAADKADASTDHFLKGLNDLPACIKNGMLKEFPSFLHADIKSCGLSAKCI